jgi:DNA polymerase III subunit beta
MKLIVSRKTLLNSLSTSSHFTTQKVQLPILANVLLKASNNKLSISATNLEMSFLSLIAAKSEQEGEITVPSKIFYEVVSNLNSENIEINVDKETLEVKNEKFSSKILGINASDFPQVPGSLSKNALKIEAGLLPESLSKVMYAVSSDESRPLLTGVLFLFNNDKLSLVATDGFRLSKVECTIKGSGKEFRVIIPKGILVELSKPAKNEEILFEYNSNDKQVVFQIGDMVISSRVIEGDFPDYEKIIPSNSRLKLSVDREDLMQGVKLASVFARSSSNVANFTIKEDSFKITAESASSGSQENFVDAKIEPDDKDVFAGSNGFTIAFNCGFVEDYLNSIDKGSVDIGFNDANSPGVFLNSEDKNLLHLIMPVKI